jgi:hypothetical protein
MKPPKSIRPTVTKGFIIIALAYALLLAFSSCAGNVPGADRTASIST